MTVDKVVDASALAAAIFQETDGPAMRSQLQNSRLFAPALLRFEIAHVCLKKIRERPVQRNAVLAQYALSLKVDVNLVTVDHAEVIDVAEKHGLSAYDASYLWLASNLGIDLVTNDRQLEKAYGVLRP